MNKGPGLVKGDCNHDEHKQEYIGTSHREDHWLCTGCGETISKYIDCGSGC